MPSALYGTGAYKRTDGNLPPLRLINMYVEKARTSEQGIALQSRPGLGIHATLSGSGPINGIYTEPGTFSGDTFAIATDTLFRNASSIGTVSGPLVAKFVSSGSELVICRGADAYSYNGTNLAAITVPWAGNVTSVAYIGSLFIFIEDGSGRFYWSSPLDGRTVDALSFATAEQAGDNLLEVVALSDNLFLFGQYTTEIWQHTGDANLPFTRMQQVTFDKGILNTGYSATINNTIYWVGHDFTVYRASANSAPERISDYWLEKRIEQIGSGGHAYPLFLDGHWLFVLRMDGAGVAEGETYALDVGTGEWFELQTNAGQFSGRCASYLDGTGTLLGNNVTPVLMTWANTWQDHWAGDPVALERRFMAAIQLDQQLTLDNVRLWCNPGQITDLTTDPQIEMRTSRDAGETWTDYDGVSLGQAGDYTSHPEWRALGMFEFPGAMLEFRLTDAAPLRISAVKFNEPGGGRG